MSRGIEPGLLVYRPSLRRQHGHGLGSFFARMFRQLLPFAKQVLFPRAVDAVENVAKDFIDGKNFKQSLKSNAMGVLKGVGKDILNQKGMGARRRRKLKSSKRKNITRPKKHRKPRKKGPKKKSNKRRNKNTKKLKKSDFITLF